MSRILPVFRRSLRESWRGLIGWSLGIAAVLFLYLPLYPSFGSGGQLQDMIKSLPKELVQTLGYDQIATGAGYAQSTFYGLMGFLLLTIAAVLWGSAAIAGADEWGASNSTSRTASAAPSTRSSRRCPCSCACSGWVCSRG